METKMSKYTRSELVQIQERLTILYDAIFNMESDLDYKRIFPRILNERGVIGEFTFYHYPDLYWNMHIKVSKYFALGELFIAINKIKKEILNTV